MLTEQDGLLMRQAVQLYNYEKVLEYLRLLDEPKALEASHDFLRGFFSTNEFEYNPEHKHNAGVLQFCNEILYLIRLPFNLPFYDMSPQELIDKSKVLAFEMFSIIISGTESNPWPKGFLAFHDTE
jgi:hypothetical protein